MPRYYYLIIGGGMTADAALHGIREVDSQNSIGLLSAESYSPYNRPPLSKGLWKGKPLDRIWRGTDKLDAELHLGRTAQQLVPEEKRVIDNQGTEYTYEKLLLATGGTPNHLPFGGDQIIYYRTLEDYQRLRQLVGRGQRFAVIGGGFIGSEIAAALAMNGKNVTMIFPERGIGERIFPNDLAQFLNDYYREKGVTVLAEQTVTGLETTGDHLTLKTSGQQDIAVDGVIAGIGIRPNVHLAEAAGIEVDAGIIVDESLQTSHPHIYAAGDVAAFHNPALNMRLRVEHEDNANTMGKLAGRAMAGEPVRYDHLPFFYSDLFDLGYEAVGLLDPRLDTAVDWAQPYRKGVIYYLREGRVAGVLLWNVWEQVEAARTLIAELGPFELSDLKGRLPA
ncbi:MAG TPA: FAD-dependent oxidoreductase [Aggregatilineales bacterium]|nr:FAD-dependent oxidoreductase [Aggregatilineales bacterium]